MIDITEMLVQETLVQETPVQETLVQEMESPCNSGEEGSKAEDDNNRMCNGDGNKASNGDDNKTGDGGDLASSPTVSPEYIWLPEHET